ncbi:MULTISPECIES: HNH endonuclease [Stenotrophomonas]|uniref:HNH endonuclease n=1 Tax=Stenotrophomonas TaxID=40323 RepID=UPI000DB2AA70|nr:MULTISPECIES: HNH endonuclease [Stenotrophomonas]MBH1524879.1 HNH endonuclease [Stenotrophomonas maltophilia]MBH1574465.1 HNH endonuclease [Stenotrophomonas maltophilia]MBH1647747.1 HNH endonuclease [Stenotrophomonas maltophilia]MBH1755406.1 HNH endonuclease [Stenotrophomonas maltophilia]MBN5024031.1 HNH endonuclease [Stenotrophomonas maltophilia]
MLWKPVTHGEELFLVMHEHVRHVFSGNELGSELGFLISSDDFIDYMKLSASIEFFMRCVRDARLVLENYGDVTPAALANDVRRNIDLPSTFWGERKFQQLLKVVAVNAGPRKASSTMEKDALQGLRRVCYMCGRSVSKQGKGGHAVLSIEHVWPHLFGGQTILENLLPSCVPCNERKGHAFSWTTGPVLSTLVHANESLSNDLRISLGLAKVAHHAWRGGRTRTLRDAILQCQPVSFQPELEPNKHHFYFELLPQARQ